MLVDYGTYIVQRHHPAPASREVVSPEKVMDAERSAKKESLRRSMEDYEKIMQGRKDEMQREGEKFLRSSEKKRQEEQRALFSISPIVNKPSPAKDGTTKMQISAIKEEVEKLSHDLAGYKSMVSESMGEVRKLVDKLKGRVPEMAERMRDLPAVPTGKSEDSIVNINKSATESHAIARPLPESVGKEPKVPGEHIILQQDHIEVSLPAPAEVHPLVQEELLPQVKTSLPQAEIPAKTENPFEHNVSAAVASVMPPLKETEEPHPEPRPDIGPAEMPTQAVAHAPAAEAGGVDPGLLKTDEFIFEKFKKIDQVKSFMKSLNTP